MIKNQDYLSQTCESEGTASETSRQRLILLLELAMRRNLFHLRSKNRRLIKLTQELGTEAHGSSE